jgi:hypothetical protein
MAYRQRQHWWQLKSGVLAREICLAALLLMLCLPADADTTEDETNGGKPGPGYGMVYLPEEGSCDLEEAEQWREDVREALFEITCHSMRWFDSLFGDTEDFPERRIGGMMRTGVIWNQYEGFDPKLRFRIRMSLPNLSSRYDAFLGRVDESAFVSDSRSSVEPGFDSGVRDDEAEWLLGLGYGQRVGHEGWDWSVGVRLRFPPRPYVRARWRYRHEFSDTFDLRFRQIFFWRAGDDGFGTTSRIDTAREISDRDVLRLELIGTVSEATEGVDWWTGQTWYHSLGNRRGLSLLTFARGETSDLVELHEYGFHLIYRRPLGRDWLFLNAGPTMTWPREKVDEKRELSLGVSVLIEMFFGNRYR